MEEDKIVIECYLIEKYIKNLQCFPLEEILSPRWIVQSCRMIQLGIQMVLESTQNKHQEVLTQIALQEKNVIFAWEILSIEAWRQKVLPCILKNDKMVLAKTNLPVQLVFHTEVAIAGILEVMISEDESVTSMEPLLLDVVDWAIRQMVEVAGLAVADKDTRLYNAKDELLKGKNDSKKNNPQLMVEEITLDSKRTLLICYIRAVGLIQQVAMRRETLPLCVTTRMLQTHDLPQLISTLMETTPWEYYHEGIVYYFEDGQWVQKPKSGLGVAKAEVQQWMILFSLLLQHENLPAYEMTPARKTSLLKLRSRLHNVIKNDLPDLEPLGKFLSTLAAWTPAPPRNPPLVTTLSQIGDAPFRMWENKWNELANNHSERVLTPTKETLNTLATRFATAFDLDALEYLLPDAPTCAMCGEPAGRRCSRCRTQWYCRRSCQVKHWKKHKTLCDLVKESTENKTISNEIKDI